MDAVWGGIQPLVTCSSASLQSLTVQAVQISSARELQQGLQEAGKHLVPLTEGNPVDAVWGGKRPAPPKAQLRVHAGQHAGESVPDKLQRMRKALSGGPPSFSCSCLQQRPCAISRSAWQARVKLGRPDRVGAAARSCTDVHPRGAGDSAGRTSLAAQPAWFNQPSPSTSWQLSGVGAAERSRAGRASAPDACALVQARRTCWR